MRTVGEKKKKKKAAAFLEINNIIKDNEVRESSEGLRHDTYRDTVATIRYIVNLHLFELDQTLITAHGLPVVVLLRHHHHHSVLDADGATDAARRHGQVVASEAEDVAGLAAQTVERGSHGQLELFLGKRKKIYT